MRGVNFPQQFSRLVGGVGVNARRDFLCFRFQVHAALSGIRRAAFAFHVHDYGHGFGIGPELFPGHALPGAPLLREKPNVYILLSQETFFPHPCEKGIDILPVFVPGISQHLARRRKQADILR